MIIGKTYEDRWMLCATDLEALEELRDELWEWRFYCDSPGDLMALGAAAHAIESILDGDKPTTTVQIHLSEITIAADDETDIDGSQVDFEISDTGIVLGQTIYIGTGQGLSRDHHCKTLAQLTDRGGFDRQAVDDWLKECRSRRGQSPSLRSDITSLPDF